MDVTPGSEGAEGVGTKLRLHLGDFWFLFFFVFVFRGLRGRELIVMLGIYVGNSTSHGFISAG